MAEQFLARDRGSNLIRDYTGIANLGSNNRKFLIVNRFTVIGVSSRWIDIFVALFRGRNISTVIEFSKKRTAAYLTVSSY